ncbi:MAG: hypothetical protein JSV17_17570 [Candidatus Aminicenantes bacterium]|nr:MAG: hypothetical protein JSV17_17570 [Candidatus Aminicenantes bacterium]
MWRLLKAEIAYNKNFLIIAYGIAVPTLIFSFIWEGGIYQKGNFNTPIIVIFHQMIFMTVLFPIILGVTIDRRSSKRAMFHALLIHPVRSLGIIYLSLPLFFWFSIVFLFWLIYPIVHEGNVEFPLIWQTLSITGLMFVLASGPLFYDLNHCLKGKAAKLILNFLGPFLYVVLVLFYYAAIIPLLGNFSPINTMMIEFSSSSLGSILFFCTGSILAALGIIIVGRRKSYVE